MSAPVRIGLVVAAVVVAVVLFLVLRDSDEEAGRAPTGAATVDATTGATAPAPTETVTDTAETAPPATTEEAPDVVLARVTIGANGPSGVQRIVAERGQQVVLTVDSQIEDEVHLHGYDLSADVAPGSPARIRFRADIPGRFEVELEHRGVQIAQIRVNP